MISFAEFGLALRGMVRLARFDAAFPGFFDLSQDGARRSFFLALPILPIFVLLQMLGTDWPDGADMTRALAAQVIGYIAMWSAFPLTLLLGAKLIDRGPRVYGVIVVYNWLNVMSVVLATPIAIAHYLGLDPQLAEMLQEVVYLFVLVCEWFAFRRLLEVSLQVLMALLVIDFVESQIVFSLLIEMSRGPLF